MKMSVLIEFLDLLSEKGDIRFHERDDSKYFPGRTGRKSEKDAVKSRVGPRNRKSLSGRVFIIRAPTPQTPTSLNPSRPRFAAESTLTSVLRQLFQNTASISQMTLGYLTVMTTGRSQKYTTPHGIIEFTHTSRSEFEIIRSTYWQDGRPLGVGEPRDGF